MLNSAGSRTMQKVNRHRVLCEKQSQVPPNIWTVSAFLIITNEGSYCGLRQNQDDDPLNRPHDHRRNLVQKPLIYSKSIGFDPKNRCKTVQ